MAVPRPVTARLQLAADVLRTEAGTLGVVTKAANRHQVTVVTDSGHPATVVRRDSVRSERPSYVAARPWKTQEPRPPKEPVAVRLRATSVPPVARPRHCVLAAARDASRTRRCEQQATDGFVLRQIVLDRASHTRPQSVPAEVRLAALRMRVAAREAAATADCRTDPQP